VLAALANPRREGVRRLVASANAAKELTDKVAGLRPGLRIEVLDGQDIGRMLPQGAVHQGLALLADPLEPADLHELGEPAEGLLVMLDQVTDPQNVGAILRSAAAFGAKGLILQDRRAPALSGALAKAAAGAADVVPVARVTNLSRALEQLSELGWRSVGLAGEAEHDLRGALVSGPTILVLGSEGEGLRRLVAEHCDTVARIPMRGGFESLNVSNAAAVALYEASQLA
jgi:23S rRNA (guanosine2251-2'-O)-methyltransferase